MENNNITSTYTSVISNEAIGEESELAILFLDILDFTGLMESQTAQTVMGFLRRLTSSQQELEYAMAV
jgi:class 3 adenylate cyclase